jgi:hypothetical protein
VDVSKGIECGAARTCILIGSCDSYSDLWPALSISYIKHWPDCPFPRFLLTNYKDAPTGFSTLAVGSDLSWSANLVCALQRLETDFILLTVDDLILTKTVRTDSVLAAIRWASVNGVTALQMVSHEHLWRGTLRAGVMPALRLPLGATYRASSVFTLWNREHLLKVLDPVENIWQFEYQGSVRLLSDSSVFLTTRSHFIYLNAVVKGKLTRSALRYFKKNSYHLSSTRQVMTKYEHWLLMLTRFRAWTFKFFPLSCRKTSKRIVQRAASFIYGLCATRDSDPSKRGV